MYHLPSLPVFKTDVRHFGVLNLRTGTNSPSYISLPPHQKTTTTLREQKKLDSRGIEPRTTPSQDFEGFDEAARC